MLTGSLNTNLSALSVERRLNGSSATLSRTFQRLSSGLRIGSAGDDAAGLAISSILDVDTRVYSQAVRNLNDAVGLLNVQEGALRELSTLSIRQRELATQAANGVLSTTQRTKLDQECQKLVEEYDRIVATTSFNGRSVLTGDSILQIQSGYGSLNLTLGFSSGGSDSSGGGEGGGSGPSAGDGTFSGRVSFATEAGEAADELVTGDINGDGRADLIVATDYYEYYAGTSSTLDVYYGAGDGQFQAPIVSGGIFLSRGEMKIADLNRDGLLDIVALRANEATISYGLGGGTFGGTSVRLVGAASSNDFTIADFNNDTYLDVAVTYQGFGGGLLFIANADATYTAGVNYTTSNGLGIHATDLDGNGTSDLIYGINGTTHINVRMGNGDGSFAAATTYVTLTVPLDIYEGDFNGDGSTDLLLPGASPSILFGNSDGSLNAATAAGITGLADVNTADLNGDGKTDLIGSVGGSVRAYLSNGDGTFSRSAAYAVTYSIQDVTTGDFNGDGILDFAATSMQGIYGPSAVDVYLGNQAAGGAGIQTEGGSTGGSTAALDLTTAQAARDSMAVIDSTISMIAGTLGNVGAGQSRLQTALANLSQARENFSAAASRIKDVDVANETSLLARAQIIQQAGVAMLAQANQTPQLMLSLLT